MTDKVAGPDGSGLSEGLGPLPTAVHYWREDVPVRAGPLMHPLYSAQQMLEYGAQERAAERERLALACWERRGHFASDAAARAFAELVRDGRA